MNDNYYGKRTKQKDIIYAGLKKLSHPSATEVYESLKEEYPAVSRATVFRVLGNFSRDGYIKRIDFSGADSRFDWDNTEHYHFVCRECGKMDDVKAPLYDFSPELPEGYEIFSREVLYTGLCPDCAKKISDNE